MQSVFGPTRQPDYPYRRYRRHESKSSQGQKSTCAASGGDAYYLVGQPFVGSNPGSRDGRLGEGLLSICHHPKSASGCLRRG
jgi:hypothetical protein